MQILQPNAYRLCQIQVPDLDQSLRALRMRGRYYSLFRTVGSASEAQDLLSRLQGRGDVAVATREEKGYGIWVLEPARIVPRQEFKTCHVRVPDLEEALPAIALDDEYYSFFKTAETLDQAQIWLDKLQQKGDFVVLTQAGKRLGLWVYEPEAQQVRKGSV